MSKVVVATFQHKHGSDVQVFASAELAEAWRQEVAACNWSNGTDEAMPSDPRAAADRYFEIGESIGDEFFSTAEAEIQGASPLHAAAPDMLAALQGMIANPRPAVASEGAGWNERYRRFEAAWDAARAAISKAEGKL